MKTEKEIREHRDALALLNAQPCDCARVGPVHNFRCQMGGIAMQSAAKALAWVLGEAPENEGVIAELIRDAAKIRKGE
jgi:hypothetical protein